MDTCVNLDATRTSELKFLLHWPARWQTKSVEVDIPRGVTNGTQIKYPGLGDNFFNTLERGDLFVVVLLQPHPNFEINGLDVVTTVRVDCLRAITGGEIEVEGIEGNRFVVNLPQSTQPDMVLRIKDQGIWQIHGSTRGNLYVKIALTVPRNLTTEQLATICEIQSTL